MRMAKNVKLKNKKGQLYIKSKRYRDIGRGKEKRKKYDKKGFCDRGDS